jgi:protein gp37
MQNSKIEWTNHTFNPWIGCQHVSPGCDHCYAEAMMDHRYGKVEWGPHGERKRTSDQYWKNPIKWNAEARDFRREHGHRPRVFCASLADMFDNQVPKEWRVDLFALIRECRRLDWLLLTKRPQNILKMLPSDWGDGYRNVWLGVTAENQTYFDQRWKHLRNIPAVIKFISYEPHWAHCGCRNTALSRIGLYRAVKAAAGRGPWIRSGFATSLRIAVGMVSRRFTSSGESTLVIPSWQSRA